MNGISMKDFLIKAIRELVNDSSGNKESEAVEGW